MAQIYAFGQYNYDFTDVPVSAWAVAANNISIAINAGPQTITLWGKFSFDAAGMPSGTVSSAVLAQGTANHVDFYGLSLDVAQAYSLATKGAYNALGALASGASSTVSVIGTLNSSAEMHTVRSFGGTSTVRGWTGPDQIVGSAGNDIIDAVTGPDLINGGGGTNTLIANNLLRGTEVVRTGESSFSYTDYTGAVSSATNIQRIATGPGSDVIAYDINGNAGQVYRLYQAALGRAPDQGGLTAHVTAVDHGFSLHDDAASFLASPEFANRYGAATTDNAFVDALYQNVLGRAADAAGQANWVNQLTAHVMDRAAVLVGFSESQENHNRVDPTIAAGIHLDYGVIG